MYRGDYYVEYNQGDDMNYSRELEELRKVYFKMVSETKRDMNENFDSLVYQMDNFLKDYRKHETAVDSYNELMGKIETEKHYTANDFIKEMKELLEEEDD